MKEGEFLKIFLKSAASAAICALATFSVIFLFIPLIAKGIPDIIWITAAVIISSSAAFFIFEKLLPAKPFYVLLSPVLQLLLLLIFAKPIARFCGFDIESGFGFFEFLGYSIPWIFGATAAQLFTLLISGKLCKGKELDR